MEIVDEKRCRKNINMHCDHFLQKKKNSKDLSQRKVLNDSLGLFIVSMY